MIRLPDGREVVSDNLREAPCERHWTAMACAVIPQIDKAKEALRHQHGEPDASR